MKDKFFKDGRFFKEWRLFVHCESKVNFIDGFDITFSCIFYDDSCTYYDLTWVASDGCDFEVAYGIISEVFEPFGFELLPIFASEVYT